MGKKYTIFIVLVFALILGFRLFFVFQYPNFSYEAHGTLRQIDNIQKTGIPLYDDHLSYGGRINLFAPFFYYVLTFFSIILPKLFALKIVPNIFSAITVFLVYAIVDNITKNKLISLIIAFFSGIIPVFFGLTLNSLSSHSIFVPLMLGFFLCLLKSDQKKYFSYAVVFLILLMITSPLTVILILTLIIYLVLLKLENIEIKDSELEFTLFMTFLVSWFNFLIFKKAFQAHSIGVIWQNIPSALLATVYSEFTFFSSINAIGIMTLVLGTYGLYYILFETKKRENYMLVAFGLSILLLLLFKLISLNTGLIYIGMLLIILSGYSLNRMHKYMKKTKFSRLSNAVLVLVLILFALTLVVPCISYAVKESNKIPEQSEIDALLWLKDNSHDDQTVLAILAQGHIVSYYAQRKNVIDSNYFLISNVQTRYDEINTVFTTKLETEAVALLNKYDVNYILLTERTYSEYNITGLDYVDDYTCFALIYNESALIYNVHCKLIGEENE